MSLTSLISLGLWLAPGRAAAERIVSERSFWNSTRDRIYTELVVEKDDGRVETVRVPGGMVDGIAMKVFSLGGAPSPYVAYVSEKTASGKPFRWEKSCVYVTVDEAGTSDVAGDGELAAVQGVLDHWNSRTASCTYMNLVMADRDSGEVRFDGINLIKFRHDRWCIPRMGDDPEECHDPAAAALTTILYIPQAGAREGIILDADIEVNAVNFAVSVGGQTQGSGEPADLANVLTHEIGHLLGLDHTCWDGLGTRPIDGDGNPVPSCSDPELPPSIVDATMYNYLDSGETKKATLEADDIRGLCEMYPLASDPGVCERAYQPPDEGFCAVASTRDPRRKERDLGGLAGVMLFFAGLLVASRLSPRDPS